jgi:protein-S-isoprenylcysteine O-methyltransferase Ste14
MVPFAVLLLALDLIVLLSRNGGGVHGVLRAVGALISCAFCVLLVWLYLRRFPSRATSPSMSAHIAAVIATPLPLAIPLLHGASRGTLIHVPADLLVLAGTAWSLWSLRWLGRNFSVIPQAREIADHGPYRWIRHPLYAGEIASALGMALAAGTATAAIVWLAFCALQAYRARREEQVLLGALPGYPAYRARTAALIPGIF